MKTLALVLFGFSQVSWAIDTDRCPSLIRVDATIERVYASSIYSQVPGWKSAQKDLNEITGYVLNYKLKEKKHARCMYKDVDGNTAVLSTASFNDPEEQNPVRVDQLTSYVTLDSGIQMVSYIPIQRYSRSGVQTYSSPFRVKIKARLKQLSSDRYSNYDIGMVSVKLR